MSETTAVAKQPIPPKELEALVMTGDLSKLSAEGRLTYYHHRCESVGLDPLARPFDYLTLNGKLVLYANKGCFEQLRANRGITISITSKEKFDDLFVVTARAMLPDGRGDEDTGAVDIGGLKGEKAANAIMKAITKAKRRVTLSICGLGLLDETEVDSIAGATRIAVDAGGAIQPATITDGTVTLTLPTGDELPHREGNEHFAADCQDCLKSGVPKDCTAVLAKIGPYLHTLIRRDGKAPKHEIASKSWVYCPTCKEAWASLSDEERNALNPPKAPPAQTTAAPGTEAAPPPPAASEKKQRPLDVTDRFDFLKLMGILKKEDAGTYYAVLGANGYEHANDPIPAGKRKSIYDAIVFAIAERRSRVSGVTPETELVL